MVSTRLTTVNLLAVRDALVPCPDTEAHIVQAKLIQTEQVA